MAPQKNSDATSSTVTGTSASVTSPSANATVIVGVTLTAVDAQSETIATVIVSVLSTQYPTTTQASTSSAASSSSTAQFATQVTTSSSEAPTAVSGTSASAPTPAPDNSKLIAVGAGLGAVVGIALIATIAFACLWRRAKNRQPSKFMSSAATATLPAMKREQSDYDKIEQGYAFPYQNRDVGDNVQDLQNINQSINALAMAASRSASAPRATELKTAITAGLWAVVFSSFHPSLDHRAGENMKATQREMGSGSKGLEWTATNYLDLDKRMGEAQYRQLASSTASHVGIALDDAKLQRLVRDSCELHRCIALGGKGGTVLYAPQGSRFDKRWMQHEGGGAAGVVKGTCAFGFAQADGTVALSCRITA